MSRESLLPALRQYRHNSGDDTLITGYDYDETNRIVEAIWQELIKALHSNDELGTALSGAHAEAIRLSGQVKYWQDLAVANRKVAEKAQAATVSKVRAMPSFISEDMNVAGTQAVIRAIQDGTTGISPLCYAYAEAAFNAYEPPAEEQEEKPKARREFLTLAEECGAVITGKPDGSEPVSVVFTPAAWQAFDAAVLKSAGGN